MQDDAILREQVDYYRARAGEYDEWFLRIGRYDRGSEHRAAWNAEIEIVTRELQQALTSGDALELACGTGLWTRHLLESHRRVVAVDASPEVVEINRARLNSDRVEYVVADLFSWRPPDAQFDSIFFGFWLSHVPPTRFDEFWATIRGWLNRGGRIFWVDSLREQTSVAHDHAPLDDSGIVHRRLNDGQEFRIVKVFYEPTDLEQRLARLGFNGWTRSSGRFFHYGCVSEAGEPRGAPGGGQRNRVPPLVNASSRHFVERH
jgi:demethylmenaquinone methyltransferase/2-methoxy-6-polyprenyl-1,4-benzoquinol methylase